MAVKATPLSAAVYVLVVAGVVVVVVVGIVVVVVVGVVVVDGVVVCSSTFAGGLGQLPTTVGQLHPCPFKPEELDTG